MPSEALKSTAITNLDAAPVVVNTAGIGGIGRMKTVDSYLTVTTGKTSGSVYQMARVRSNAIIKHILVCLDVAVTTLDADIGLYYSDGTTDGTLPANSGAVIDADRFASAVDLHLIVTPTDYVNESGTYTAAKRQMPIWQGAGLSADPGGFFDVCLTTTSTNSGAAVIHCEVQFVD